MNKLTFDDIDRLVELSQEPLEDRQLELGNEKGEPYYRFLYHLICETKPKLSLEIGVGWGLGSAHMCVASRLTNTNRSYVAGIDIITTVLIEGLRLFYSNYVFFPYGSENSITQYRFDAFVKAFGPLSIVFQDSSHHYEASCKEWDIYTQFLDDNAIWICDDITESFYRPGLDEKSMVGYFEERPGEKKLYNNLHHGSTMGVILL